MMGTRATILLADRSPARAEALIEAAFDRMAALAALLTRFEAGSEIGRANAATGNWTAVSDPTATVVEDALAIARASDGAFDPALDRLSELWGFHRRRAPAPLPNGLDLAPWREWRGFRFVTLDRTRRGARLRIEDARAGIDLGGIAKGYAIDRAVDVLREHGVRHALVEAGGDLFALGRQPDGSPWPVGVRDPRRPDRLQAVLSAADEGIATSGDYENFFELAGQRYAHILEPRGARPAAFLRSLTVRARSATVADALATAGCAARGEQELNRLLARLGASGWLAVPATGGEWRA